VALVRITEGIRGRGARRRAAPTRRASDPVGAGGGTGYPGHAHDTNAHDTRSAG
jgi:hypothetical protein